MPDFPLRKTPDFGKYQGILGIVLGTLFTLFLANTIEVNWICSAIIYFGILWLAVWSFQAHAAPHRRKIFRIIGVITYLIIIGSMGYYGTYKQFHRDQPPDLPQIILQHTGYPLGAEPNTNLCWNTFSIENTSDREIDNLTMRIQLPEVIVDMTPIKAPAGINAEWDPEFYNGSVENGTANYDTNGNITLNGHSAISLLFNFKEFNRPIVANESPRISIGKPVLSGTRKLTGVWRLNIDKLPPNCPINCAIVTSSAWRNNTPKKADELLFYAEGEYQFNTAEKIASQYYFAPIKYDPSSGFFTLLKPRKNYGDSVLVVMYELTQ